MKEVGSVGGAHGDDVTDEMVLTLEVLKDGNVTEWNDISVPLCLSMTKKERKKERNVSSMEKKQQLHIYSCQPIEQDTHTHTHTHTPWFSK